MATVGGLGQRLQRLAVPDNSSPGRRAYLETTNRQVFHTGVFCVSFISAKVCAVFILGRVSSRDDAVSVRNCLFSVATPPGYCEDAVPSDEDDDNNLHGARATMRPSLPFF